MFNKLTLPIFIMSLVLSLATRPKQSGVNNEDDFLNSPPLIVKNFDVLPIEENRSRYLTLDRKSTRLNSSH